MLSGTKFKPLMILLALIQHRLPKKSRLSQENEISSGLYYIFNIKNYRVRDFKENLYSKRKYEYHWKYAGIQKMLLRKEEITKMAENCCCYKILNEQICTLS